MISPIGKFPPCYRFLKKDNSIEVCEKSMFVEVESPKISDNEVMYV